MTKSRVVWGIHAGKTGDADTLFLKKKVIAIGWPEMGDLSKLAPNREAFKEQCRRVYPQAKERTIASYAGQLLRFTQIMKPGDYILYPSKTQKLVYIGEVTGDYYHVEPKNSQDHYVNQRPVKWLKDFPRTYFSKDALYELGTGMSFFCIKNHADEYIAALYNKS